MLGPSNQACVDIVWKLLGHQYFSYGFPLLVKSLVGELFSQLDLSVIRIHKRSLYGTEGDRIVDRWLDARSRAGPAELGDSCGGKELLRDLCSFMSFRLYFDIEFVDIVESWKLLCDCGNGLVVQEEIYDGYHQLRVHEDAIPKTTFQTRYIHFESTIMPLGDQCTAVFLGLNEKSQDFEDECVTLRLIKCSGVDALSRKGTSENDVFDAMAMPFILNLRYLSENEIESPWILSVNFQDNSKEWNSDDDQLRFRWMIYLMVLADAAESTSKDIMRACVIDFGGSYQLSIRCAPFEALYVVRVEVGDRVLLKVTPWKGVVHFGKKGKLAPRYVGPFGILERIGLVAYRLRLHEELNSVHDTFHVSNLKKCLAGANLHVSLNEIKINKTLRFFEEPVEIMNRGIMSLKRSKISLVKVR
ncbi:hypothetical protein Tco_0790473 [Tanacetum coccineum]